MISCVDVRIPLGSEICAVVDRGQQVAQQAAIEQHAILQPQFHAQFIAIAQA